MSNIFKSEPRSSVHNKHNHFKDDAPRNRNRFGETSIDRYNRMRDEQLQLQKEFEEKEKERLTKEALSSESFPEFVKTQPPKTEYDNSFSYIDKLKTEDAVTVQSLDPDLDNLNPGWVLYKKDNITGNTVVKRHPYGPVLNVASVTTEDTSFWDVVNALSETHKARTDEYIENYGYDEWETHFKFSDWREREIYLEEMDELANMTDEDNDDEEDYDNETYDNYMVD